MPKIWTAKDALGPLQLGASQVDDGAEYLLDRSYRDSSDRAQNEFYSWLKVKNSGGIRPRKAADGSLAYLVLVSSHVSVATYNPWDDVIDPGQGRFYNWGYAKLDERHRRDDFEGNKYLHSAWGSRQ